MSKYSMYGKEFQNWGGQDKKLVLCRPKEKIYPMKFTGKSMFTIDQLKVQAETKFLNKQQKV